MRLWFRLKNEDLTAFRWFFEQRTVEGHAVEFRTACEVELLRGYLHRMIGFFVPMNEDAWLPIQDPRVLTYGPGKEKGDLGM